MKTDINRIIEELSASDPRMDINRDLKTIMIAQYLLLEEIRNRFDAIHAEIAPSKPEFTINPEVPQRIEVPQRPEVPLQPEVPRIDTKKGRK